MVINETINKQQKIELICKKADKKMMRRVLKISSGQFLVMEKTDRLNRFFAQKVGDLTEEELEVLLKKLER